MSVFENLVGQEHVVEIIKSAVAATRSGAESQEMTHAWVFTGPPGSGRSSAAVAFAQALVCPKDGCGDCNQCKSAANGAHPDVEIIRTEGLSIKIDEVRELLTRVAWAPSMGCGVCAVNCFWRPRCHPCHRANVLSLRCWPDVYLP